MSIALHYSFRKIDLHTFCDDDQISEESVEQVYLKACDLEDFPKWLIRLGNLTHIVISSNLLETIPHEIHHLINLNYLDISDNQIMELPSSLFSLIELKFLDVSGNFIAILPKEIKNLRNLEVLNFSRNFITEVPNELTECRELFQISFDECCRLFIIPKNIFTLPRLVIASFKKCSLIVIPSVVPTNLCSLSIEGNQLLNCIPQEILKFLPSSQCASDFYLTDENELETLQNARTEFIKNSDVNYVKFSSLIANVPYDFKKLFFGDSIGEIPSLQELCMRNADRKLSPFLPSHLLKIMFEPTAICACRKDIFSEAHVVFYQEKSRQNTHLIISKYFCSKSCTITFIDENIEKISIQS